MAIDVETGKRIKQVKTKLDIEKEKAEKARSVTNYEEELKKSLFKGDKPKYKEVGGEATEDDEVGYYEETHVFEHVKRDGEWDVPLSEDIRYFDPTLSYELTGYRPISMTDGLDFDPEPFTEAARTYENSKEHEYTSFPPGSKPYKDYWREQFRRCVEGYTVGKYRITGDHYFFLNFYRMQTVNMDQSKTVRGRRESFPSFLAKQYEFFHYVELCEYLGKDVCMLKARGLGFSEILACLGVRPFTTTREFRTVYTADSDAHLNPTLTKVWKQLNWLNTNTQGGMKHLRQKIDNMLRKRASMITAQGDEIGPMSEIEGIVADNPSKVRGDRTERLIFEEAGSNKNMITSWIQGDALVNLGGEKVGLKICGGTGGDSGPNLAGLASMFRDPMSYNVLPYKNFYNRNNSVQYTGFFIPAHEFSLKPEYLDNRGVTDSIRFKKYYEDKRSSMRGKDAITYAAENCFTPDEALLKQGDNLFDADIIATQITRIETIKDCPKPFPVSLYWQKDSNGDLNYKDVGAFNQPGSKLLILEPPQLFADGTGYKNLYVAGVDGIDQGSSESASDYDVSDFCIVIKKRAFGMSPPKYVAIYKDRPQKVETAYEIAAKLVIWYNAQVVLEATKFGFKQFLEKKHLEGCLMPRPEFAMTGKNARNRGKRLIGIPSTPAVISHGLELISDYVVNSCEDIYFEDMLQELLNYSYEDKRKFDIIAAMQCAEIGDEELMAINPSKKTVISTSDWQDIGYYIDDKGYRRYGVIPKKNNTLWQK